MLPFVPAMPAIITSIDEPVLTSGFPTVGSTTVYNGPTGGASSHQINVPPGTVSGNLVFIFASMYGDAFFPLSISASSGWTEIISFQNSGTQRWFKGYARVVTGNTPFTINTGNGSILSAVGLRFTNSTTYAIASTTGNSGTSVNPPALSTPEPWGETPHVTWIALGQCAFNLAVTPAGFSNVVSSAVSSTASVRTTRANIQSNSVNPGPYTQNTSAHWVASTIAVRGPLA